MSDDRHPVDEAALAKAAGAVPDELHKLVGRAENGGPYSVEMISDLLLDYVAARSAGDDPGFEQRETWAALHTAARTAADYFAACATPVGETAGTWVDYLGVGVNFTIEFAGSVDVSSWIHAFHLTLICRDTAQLERLAGAVGRLPDKAQTGYARALAGVWAASAEVDVAAIWTSGGEAALLRALHRRDREGFQQELGKALEQHREGARGEVRALVAWGPLALAVLAYDRGIGVEVSSRYLPVRLVTGEGPKTAGVGAPIPRPAVDEQWPVYLERLEGYDQGSVPKLLAPDNLNSHLSRELRDYAARRMRTFRLRSLADPAAELPRQWADLVLASQAAAATFLLFSAEPGAQTAVTLGGLTVSAPGCGPTNSTTYWEYSRAVALALAVRSPGERAALGGLPDTVFAGDTRVADAVHYGRALHVLLAGGDPLPHLETALSKTSGDEFWECLRAPRVRLLDRILAGDQEGVTRMLTEGIDLYRQYYSTGEHRGDFKFEGLISIDMLGLACLAHDRGLAIEVETDYLPARIVTGAWTGTTPDFSPFL